MAAFPAFFVTDLKSIRQLNKIIKFIVYCYAYVFLESGYLAYVYLLGNALWY